MFIASIAVIVREPAAGRTLFKDTLGLPLEAQPGDDYIHSEQIDGSKHFGVWPLEEWYRLMHGIGAARIRDTYLPVLRPWFGFLNESGYQWNATARSGARVHAAACCWSRASGQVTSVCRCPRE